MKKEWVFGALLAGAVCLLHGCVQPPHQPNEVRPPLHKVVISRDKSGFQDSRGKPFQPCGVNYFRPGTGWAPQVWKKFDADATRHDLLKLKEMGFNTVRVFLTYGSFYTKRGVLNAEGVQKLDLFLQLAEEAGIYVHPTGPDHWEGRPEWGPVGVEEDETVAALEEFWHLLAARYRGRSVIFAYDLKNEPEVGWRNPTLESKWSAWVIQKYGSVQKAAAAWGLPNTVDLSRPPHPDDHAVPALVLDYQIFREELADRWTARQAAAIKTADPDALVTVGLIQWSVPAMLPAGPRHYSAFRPSRQAEFLDFLEIHFYPFANGVYQYQADEEANLAYLESVLNEARQPGKPLVLAEFGWFGGGKPTFQANLPFVSQEEHAKFCLRLLQVSEGLVSGWLNWGFYDHSEAKDCTELTGLLTADGSVKQWGRVFSQWSKDHRQKRFVLQQPRARPSLEWESCLVDRAQGDAFRQKYLDAYLKDRHVIGHPTRAKKVQ